MTVIVWSKPQCPHCDQAKALLKLNDITYEERMIGEGYTKEDLLAEVPTARSVPQIILDGKLIGGFTDLKKHLKG